MNKLNENQMENIVGGQIAIENVMGVKGLFMCTGAPTKTNPEGVFWKQNGISLTRNEAMDLLKKRSTRALNEEDPDEAFLAKYIQEYNDEVDGYKF